MNGISRRAPGLTIQVVALNKDRMVALASQPNVAFTAKIQLNTFAYVETEDKQLIKVDMIIVFVNPPSSFALFRAVYIAQRSQAEAITTGRINVAINCNMGLA